MFRQLFGSNDRLNHSDIVTRTKRTLMTCQPADATSFIDAARGDQGVGGASYFSHYVGEKRKGALRVSGENKDGIPVNVILYLKEVQLQRALDNNLVPGTKYAHFEHYTRTPNEAAATENAILPLLKRSDEPAVQALGNKHLVSGDHFATLSSGFRPPWACPECRRPSPSKSPKCARPRRKPSSPARNYKQTT